MYESWTSRRVNGPGRVFLTPSSRRARVVANVTRRYARRSAYRDNCAFSSISNFAARAGGQTPGTFVVPFLGRLTVRTSSRHVRPRRDNLPGRLLRTTYRKPLRKRNLVTRFSARSNDHFRFPSTVIHR